MLALFFLACEATTDMNLEYGNTNTNTEEETIEECIPLEGTYEHVYPNYKFGPLAFQMQPESQTFQDTDTIRAMGMNTISLRFIMPIDSEGRLKYPYVRNHLYYASLEDQICQMGNTIHELKKKASALSFQESHTTTPKKNGWNFIQTGMATTAPLSFLKPKKWLITLSQTLIH